MANLTQVLKTSGNSLTDKLRGVPTPQFSYTFPEPKTTTQSTDFGIPLSDFHSQLNEIQDQPLPTIRKAIDQHPDIPAEHKQTAWEKALSFLGGVQDTVEKMPGVKQVGGVLRGLAESSSKAQTEWADQQRGISAKIQETITGKKLTPEQVSKIPAVDFSVGSLEKNIPKAFEGFKDLSTSILKQLEGKTSVSKQFIEDLTNQGGIRQPERDLIRKTLGDYKGDVPVKDFANKVKTELLPLEAHTSGSSIKPNRTSADYRLTPRYENISLPPELRGKVADYRERIYNSPIETSAGKVHFGSASNDVTGKGYFAHSRIEDLPGKDTTRRVIEIQSDLFQKGRLESQYPKGEDVYPTNIKEAQKLRDREARREELVKLEPYRNTWHERVIREEVKQAAIDGKTKLQFPTGETAMKIEGLGVQDGPGSWVHVKPMKSNTSELGRFEVKSDDLKAGLEIKRQGSDSWIITDVLGDGKFKAVPKSAMDNFNRTTGKYETDTVEGILKYIKENPDASVIESFDISGKVDTSNPIYKFYEKDVRKFLQNKFNAKEITDPQGVKWIELDVPKEAKDKAVQAYGGAKINTLLTGAGLGVGAVAIAPLLASKTKPEDRISAIEDGIQRVDSSASFDEMYKIITEEKTDMKTRVRLLNMLGDKQEPTNQ